VPRSNQYLFLLSLRRPASGLVGKGPFIIRLASEICRPFLSLSQSFGSALSATQSALPCSWPSPRPPNPFILPCPKASRRAGQSTAIPSRLRFVLPVHFPPAQTLFFHPGSENPISLFSPLPPFERSGLYLRSLCTTGPCLPRLNWPKAVDERRLWSGTVSVVPVCKFPDEDCGYGSLAQDKEISRFSELPYPSFSLHLIANEALSQLMANSGLPESPPLRADAAVDRWP